jgi:hypothetical protein
MVLADRHPPAVKFDLGDRIREQHNACLSEVGRAAAKAMGVAVGLAVQVVGCSPGDGGGHQVALAIV